MRIWFWVVLISVDQMLNAVFGPLLNFVLRPVHLFGDPDETLSSVMGKNVKAGTCRACRTVCKIMHYFDPGHCAGAIENDEGRSRDEPRGTTSDRS